MKKYYLNKIEKRVIIILMLINSFALFVNYFALSPKFETDSEKIYLFTDNGNHLNINGGGATGSNAGYYHTLNDFWPFVDYKVWDEWNDVERFRGIFDGFDHIEFMAYTFLIFGIVYIRKIW